MNQQSPSNRWYYAQNKKKKGPIALAELRRLLAAGVLTPTEMILQEGTTTWRRLAEVVNASPGIARTGGVWKPALVGIVGLGVLILIGWGLAALLHGPNRQKGSEQPGAVADAATTPTSRTAPNEEAAKDPAAKSTKVPAVEAPVKPAREPSKTDKKMPAATGLVEPAGGAGKMGPVSVSAQVGHASTIRCAVFSRDGKLLLTGSEDKTARLWDAVSGREIRVLRSSADGGVNQVALSADGRWALTVSGFSKVACLWETATGKEVRRWDNSKAWVWAGAFSPDSRWIVTVGGEKGSERGSLWEVATGREVRRFQGHTGLIGAVAFSPDGKQVLSGSHDKTVRLWDVQTGTEVRCFNGHTGLIGAVAFSPDGKQVLSGSGDNTARLWDAGTGQLLRTFEAKEVNFAYGLAFSSDGSRLLGLRGRTLQKAKIPQVLDLNDPAVRRSLNERTALPPPIPVLDLWDLTERKAVNVFDFPKGKITTAAISPDGKQVFAGCEDGLAWLADAGIGNSPAADERKGTSKSMALPKSIRQLGGKVSSVQSVAFSSDGKKLLVGDGNSVVWLRDAATGRVLRTFYGLTGCFSPDGKQVLTRAPQRALQSGESWLWETDTGKKIHTFTGDALAFSPDGKHVLTWILSIGRGGSYLMMWDTASGEKIREDIIPMRQRAWPDVTAAAFSPNGTMVAVGIGQESVQLWSYGKRPQIRGAGLNDSATQETLSVAFSPDNRHLLWGGNRNRPRMLDLATREERELHSEERDPLVYGPDDKVYSVTFSPSGNWMLTGHEDQLARLWDAGNGKQLRAFRGHEGDVGCVAFSPDGKQVFTGSKDGTARLWDPVTGRELCKMLGFRDGSWVAVTPENYYLASRSALDGVAFRVGIRTFPFDQFDLKFNRPDKVLESIGMASKEEIAPYRHAYQKRLKRMHFTEEMLADDFHLPEVALTADVPRTTSNKTIKFTVRASDTKYMLDRLNVYVNGVPLHSVAGIGLRDKKVRRWEQEIEIELSAGKNTIHVSALNEKGAESLRDTREILCEAPAIKPDLYVVVVGVSAYQDQRFRLTYADKDANDLADYLNTRKDFNRVRLVRLLNQEATRDKILKVKTLLKESRVDDQVIVFFSGHGLLDDKLDYYFATADMDFRKPSAKGMSYEAIEDLLDGIHARKKLLLMDTCHSGEVDKEESQVAVAEKVAEGEVKGRTIRGLQRVFRDKPLGLKNSLRVQQELFADLRRGSGAVIISAAGGMEFALESREWNNGVFTYALLHGLKDKQADRNKDGRIQISELREHVMEEVRRLTRDRQAPTVRMENLEFDYIVDVGQPMIAAPKPEPRPKPKPEKTTKRELTQADIVGLWRHKPGQAQPGQINLLPNGKINASNSRDTWSFNGTTLVLRWANKKAPGGFWIDTCTVSGNGKTYRGVNQKRVVITGEKVSD